MQAMSVPQLAERLGVSRTTIHNRVVRGEIQAEKVGHSHIVPAHVVRQLMRDRTAQIAKAVRRVVFQYGAALERLAQG
jgi:excisionase family DNA binding protein